jgi:solute carrier family 13 (sodium-dependent dicarboxylate transporter), member 2/3/5
MTPDENDHAAGGQVARKIGLVAGVLAFGLMTWIGPPADLSPKAWSALSLLSLMIIWWVSEAIPVAATALLPLCLLPLLGVVKPVEAAAPYGDPIIFLFIGGFMVAAAIEQCGLHKRIAMGVLVIVGSSPAAIVGGFMIATTLLSMWISNTATALMMMPIALAAHTDGSNSFGRCLLRLHWWGWNACWFPDQSYRHEVAGSQWCRAFISPMDGDWCEYHCRDAASHMADFD